MRMSLHQPLFLLVIVATALDGLLAGASLDQSIKQLPARRRIGVIAYSAYARAADLGTGILWYAVLGVGGALLTIVAAIVALIQAAPSNVALLLYLAAAASLAHSFTTSRAAPTMLSQRRVSNSEPELTAIFARFERWQTARAILQVVTFGLMLWALAAIAAQ
jgi:hypothetical protein